MLTICCSRSPTSLLVLSQDSQEHALFHHNSPRKRCAPLQPEDGLLAHLPFRTPKYPSSGGIELDQVVGFGSIETPDPTMMGTWT